MLTGQCDNAINNTALRFHGQPDFYKEWEVDSISSDHFSVLASESGVI